MQPAHDRFASHRPSSSPGHRSRPGTGLLLALGLGLLSSGCVRSSGRDAGPPVFSESELNDSVFTANDFGVLYPGDRFFIRGDISDLACDPFDPFAYCDPFDGFAFTAGEPIYVEFRLFMDRFGHDFDVCLYDPQLDLTVDCFQSPNDPEFGAIEVLAGGLDFHLVVESFFGTGGYELEIDVYPLYGAGAAPPEEELALSPEALAAGAGLRAREEGRAPAREGVDAKAYAGYGKERDRAPAPAPESLGELHTIEVDPVTGDVEMRSFRLRPDGLLEPLGGA